MPLIIQSLDLKNNQVIIDLGAGDGIVIFEAAQKSMKAKLNTNFIAVEINPILVFILHIRRLLHPNRKHIQIMWQDMFKIPYKDFIKNEDTEVIFYLYVSPWFLEKTATMIKELKRTLRVISYFYPIHSLKTAEHKLEGVHKVYNYEIKL